MSAVTTPPDRRTETERLMLRHLRADAAANDVDEPLPPRPRTRGDCAGVPRPCPFVSCRHNLYLDVRPDGAIRHLFPGLEPDEMADSCSLDVAARGGLTLESVARVLGLTRERIRQIETQGQKSAKKAAKRMGGIEDVPIRGLSPLGAEIG